MALQTSGAISLANVQTEFGGGNPISISEYYGKAAGIPASGTISLSHFYGKSNIIREPASGEYYGQTHAFMTTNVGFIRILWNGTVFNIDGDDSFTSCSNGGYTYYKGKYMSGDRLYPSPPYPPSAHILRYGIYRTKN